MNLEDTVTGEHGVGPASRDLVTEEVGVGGTDLMKKVRLVPFPMPFLLLGFVDDLRSLDLLLWARCDTNVIFSFSSRSSSRSIRCPCWTATKSSVSRKGRSADRAGRLQGRAFENGLREDDLSDRGRLENYRVSNRSGELNSVIGKQRRNREKWSNIYVAAAFGLPKCNWCRKLASELFASNIK